VRTSPFGPRWGRNHDGVDIAAPSGAPVRAAECGVVTVRGVQGGYGNMICVQHSDRFETCYAHLSGFAVNGGQTVRRGQVIGYVGCTGHCTGPHLHFETRVDGRAQNPDTYLRGASVPGNPRVGQASQERAIPAAARSTGAHSEWQRAAGASTPRSASFVNQAPPRPSAPEEGSRQAPVEQAPPAPAPAPAQPEAIEPAPAPAVEEAAPAPVVEAPAPLPVAEPVVEAPAPLPVAEPEVEAPAAQAPAAEPVVEAPAPLPVAEPEVEAPAAQAPVAEPVPEPELPTAEAEAALPAPGVEQPAEPAPVAEPAPIAETEVTVPTAP